MEDFVTVHAGDSPEHVALQLMLLIMEAERISPEKKDGYITPDRGYILFTFRECLDTVRGPGRVTKRDSADLS